MDKFCFISGHLDLTEEEFDKHYSARILNAIKMKWSFVVGDAKGADLMAQRFIKQHGGLALVFHMFTKARNNVGFTTLGGFNTDEERDAAMTAISRGDIAWVRKGRGKGGTQANIDRRGRRLASANQRCNTDGGSQC